MGRMETLQENQFQSLSVLRVTKLELKTHPSMHNVVFVSHGLRLLPFLLETIESHCRKTQVCELSKNERRMNVNLVIVA